MKLVFAIFISLLMFTNLSKANLNEMKLQGKGTINYLGFIKVYDAALYTDYNGDIHDILDPKISKCLQLDYDVALTSDDFILGANAILDRQHTQDQISHVQKEVRLLHDAYKPVEQGDSYRLCYDGNTEITTLSLNQEKLIAIQSPDFGKIYLGIWLGSEYPIDEDLRNDLLRGHK